MQGTRPKGTVASTKIRVRGRRIDVHAVHVPNGTNDGWAKIDHLWALRCGLEPSRDDPPQVLCGDFKG